jgi:regulator of replication initiation timing
MSIIDTAKDVYELAKKGATMDLQERLMELREQAITLQEENMALRAKNRELEEALSVKESLKWDGSVYWRELPDGEKEGPYCPRCYDVDDRLVRVHEGGQYWFCNACTKYFKRR